MLNTKNYFIESINALLKDCDIDTLEAVYNVIRNLRGRSTHNGLQRRNKKSYRVN